MFGSQCPETKAVGFVVCALLCCTGRVATARPQLRFVRFKDLPALGLRVRLMQQADPHPFAPPTRYLRTRERGAQTVRDEVYRPVDLWRQTQQAGRWTGRYGNTVVFARIDRLLPRGMLSGYATAAEFKAAFGEIPAMGPDDWDANRLALWAADFLGVERADAAPVPGRSVRFRALVKLTSPTMPFTHLAYAFRLNRNQPALRTAPDNWFFVLFELAMGVDPASAEQAILRDFLGSVTVSASGPREPRVASRRAPPVPDAAAGSPAYQVSRERAIDSIRNMPGWWYVGLSRHIILANLRSRSGSLIRQLRSDLDRLRDAFERLVPPRKPVTDVSVIRMFETEEGYERYVGADTGTSAMWLASKGELVIRPPRAGRRRDEREETLRRVYHEAFHQYVHYAFDHIAPSAWYNEGHAELMACAQIKRDGVRIEEDRDRAEILKERAKDDALDVQALLGLSYEQFYDPDPFVREWHYTLAWGLIYYLRKGAPASNPPKYTGILDAYADSLWESRDPDAATDAAFAAVDPAALREELTKFWRSTSRRGAARRYRLFGAQR